MGMYTELFISTMVRDEPEVVQILKYMLTDVGLPPKLPDHPLFTCDRWSYMLRCSSHYFVPRSTHLFERDNIAKEWVLITRSDLKAYSGEIEKFVGWLRPYLACSPDTMIGYSRYAGFREPTIIYSTEPK